jgi:hypothetical protein
LQVWFAAGFERICSLIFGSQIKGFVSSEEEGRPATMDDARRFFATVTCNSGERSSS